MTDAKNPNSRTIDAIVLAGGFGTRLAERVPGRPKALAPVGGRPFLSLQLEWLSMQPVGRAVIAAHFMADQIMAFAEAYNGKPLPLSVIMEEEPLGTGGAVANVLSQIDGSDPVLVINGDTYFGFDLAPAIDHHRASGMPATLFVAEVADVARYGTVVSRDGLIESFHQATGKKEPGLVSCGAYLLDPALLTERKLNAFSIEKDFFPQLAKDGRLGAFAAGGEDAFFDIGVPDDYELFRERVGGLQNNETTDPLCIPENATLRDAMRAIQRSGKGICFISDAENKIVGVMTDGDIRRALLEDAKVDDAVSARMNREFVSVSDTTPKEQTLKLLGSRIRSVPVLDKDRRLVSVVGTGYAPSASAETYVRAKAPVRISLSGGGTDFTDYFVKFGGECLTATTTWYSHATMRRRNDQRIIIHSYDRQQRVEAESLNDLVYDGQLDLIKAGVRVMQPETGFELQIGSDFPPGSGLGGSAAVLSAVIGCLNELRETNRLDNYAIAEHAYEAERVELGIAGGWQDQYATAFGGFNLIEFTSDRNIVTPLRLERSTVQELEERFLLCNTGQSHGGRHVQERNRAQSTDPAQLKIAEQFKSIANEMKTRLLRGSLDGFGDLLDRSWELKRRYSEGATTETIDNIHAAALEAGAEGGRLLGTGGGGFFLFCVDPFRRHDVIAAMRACDVECHNIVFDHHGLQSWVARG